MNPQAYDIDFNDPKIQKAWAYFQQQQKTTQMPQNPLQMNQPMPQNPLQMNQQMPQQMPLQMNQQMPQQMPLQMNQQMSQMPQMNMQQMLFQQQQQQQQQYMMMMQQYQLFQQQQLYNKFLNYCSMTGTNPNDQGAFMAYCNSMQNQMPNSQNNINLNNNNNFQQQQINNMAKSQGNQVMNQASAQNTNNVYVNDPNQPKEVIPRKEETLYLNAAGGKSGPTQLSAMGMGNNNVINVTLTATSGLKVVIAAPKTMTFSELFKNYVKKVGVPEDVIGTKIVFLFNAEKLKVDSQEPISTLFKTFNANVTVLDQGNIIGA